MAWDEGGKSAVSTTAPKDHLMGKTPIGPLSLGVSMPLMTMKNGRKVYLSILLALELTVVDVGCSPPIESDGEPHVEPKKAQVEVKVDALLEQSIERQVPSRISLIPKDITAFVDSNGVLTVNIEYSTEGVMVVDLRIRGNSGERCEGDADGMFWSDVDQGAPHVEMLSGQIDISRDDWVSHPPGILPNPALFVRFSLRRNSELPPIEDTLEISGLK